MKKQGFTLVELLVVFIAMIIVIAIVWSVSVKILFTLVISLLTSRIVWCIIGITLAVIVIKKVMTKER